MSAHAPYLLRAGKVHLAWVQSLDTQIADDGPNIRTGVARIYGDERFVAIAVYWPHAEGEDLDAWVESPRYASEAEAREQSLVPFRIAWMA